MAPLILAPHLAREFFDALYSAYLKEATRPAYIEVRGRRECDPPGKMPFRAFYLGIDSLVKAMGSLRTVITGSAWPRGGATPKERKNIVSL